MNSEPSSNTAKDDPELQSGSGVSRRTFLKISAAAGGGLLLGFIMPEKIWRTATAEAKAEAKFSPNAFIRIGRTGLVTFVMPYVEMGQGTYTSIPMLIAEELEVDLKQVTLEAAPPDIRHYANPLLQMQVTGGSTSVKAAWDPLRRAGAAARMVLVAAAAQKWKVDPASCRAHKGKVTHTASGRTLAYGALVDTAATLPMPDKIVLKDPKDFTLIGTPAKRLDAPNKVNGKAIFGIDVKLPGMKIATVTACPVFGGKLASVDDSRAKTIKGVRQVVRLDNAVAVIGDHMWAAKQGLAALTITWDEGPHAKINSADIVAQLDAASRQESAAVAGKAGDAAKAMAGAATKIEAVYQMPFLAHATMEPMNCTVHVGKDECHVWVGSQIVTHAQAAASEVTGLPLEKVHVHNQLLGGGFGRRLEVDCITQAVQIAKHVNYPVKVVWTREEDIRHDMYRPYYYDRIAAGLDEQGTPIAWQHRIAGSSVYARWMPAAFKDGFDPDVEGADKPLYTLPNILVEYVRQEPPGIPTGFWRGVGPTHTIFVVESFIDELAAAAKKDPVEYRRALLDNSPRAAAVLDLAAKKAGWGTPLPARHGRGVSVQFAFGSYIAQVVEVEVRKDGDVRATRVVCAVDCGVTVNPDTVKAQIEGGIMFGLTAALYGEITLKDGRVEQSNFHDYQMLRINEAPAVEVYLVKSAEAPGGIGEPGTAALAPALMNAIFAATGTRIRKLPVNRLELRST